VVTIRLTVDSATVLSSPIVEEFAVSTGSGTIRDLEPATDYVVTAEGLNASGNVLYQGTKSAVSVMSGHNTAVTIVMNPLGGSITVTWDAAIYASDFTSDPGWATSDASRFYWDSSQQAYYMDRINIVAGGNYAIKDVGVSMASRSFRLEWDIKMISVDYACDLRFGLFDTDMNASDNGSFAWVLFTREDRGYQILLASMGSDNVGHSDWTAGTQYSVGTWYHVIMSYDATTGQLTATITDRSTGNLVRSLSTTTGAFAADMDRVGLSDIWTGTPQVPGAQAAGYIDNVQLVLQ